MAELKQAAKKIKKAGQAEAPSDSILAHITPEEAMMLKAMGGSGQVDPKTGLPHFEENDENEGYNDDGSWDGGGGNSNSGVNDNFDVDHIVDNAISGKGEYKGPYSKESYDKGDVRDVTRDRGPGDDSDAPTFIPTEDTPLRGAVPGFPESVPSVTKNNSLLGGILGGAGGFIGGPLIGVDPITGAKLGYKAGSAAGAKQKRQESGLGDTSGWNSSDGLKKNDLGEPSENKGNDDSPMEAQFRKTATPSAPATPPPSEQAAADDFDSFTQGARKKKGLQSTIVSGGAGGSGIAMNKTLLGA